MIIPYFLPNLQMGATPSSESASSGTPMLMLMGVGRAIIIGLMVMVTGGTQWI